MSDQQQLYQLEKRIDNLEARTGLLSKSWFSRAITAWAYVNGIQLLAGLIVLLLGLVFGLLG